MTISTKQKHRVEVRLNDEDYLFLMNNVEQSGMTREAYLRSLIKLLQPRGKPSEDYINVFVQLKRIGNNINQLTMLAHQTQSIDMVRLKDELFQLERVTAEIKMIASQPYKFGEELNGNNQNMVNKI